MEGDSGLRLRRFQALRLDIFVKEGGNLHIKAGAEGAERGRVSVREGALGRVAIGESIACGFAACKDGMRGISRVVASCDSGGGGGSGS